MREKRFDVVVAGCGVAGLSAPAAAAEAGARVVVLERAPPAERGGQSRYTEAYLRMQSEAEVTDDFETHLAENSSGILDPDIIAESARPPGERAACAAAISMAEPG
ncbi:MAG: FAD-dependent oxidoreductase, partial [Acetobacteraceae bacterium]